MLCCRERDELLAACAEAHRELQLSALLGTEDKVAGLVRGAAAQLRRSTPWHPLPSLACLPL